MRRRTTLALVAGGARPPSRPARSPAPGARGADRRHRRRTRTASSRCTRPVGRTASGQRAGRLGDREDPCRSLEAGVYDVVAEMLDLQPDDELLDIGCGPGAFLATKAQHVRRVVGLDPSRTMLREAERRLADRIAGGTARLVHGSAAALPFGDGEFSAVTAIFAPPNPAEAFRVLRPGGRFVFVDQRPKEVAERADSRWGRLRLDRGRLPADDRGRRVHGPDGPLPAPPEGPLTGPTTCSSAAASRRRRDGAGLQTRHDQPALRPPPVDQLLGREARPRTQVREVPLRRARPDADELRCIRHRPASGNERGQDVDLAGRRRPRERPTQVPVSHTGLTRLRVMSPRTTAVTARIAPIWSGARLRPNATTRAITAWTRASTIAGSRPKARPLALPPDAGNAQDVNRLRVQPGHDLRGQGC